MKIKKFVILFIIISIISQGLVIPVQAEGINPYERFNTSLVDDMYYTDYRVPNLRSRGIGNFGDTAWVVYKNMDFGKIGPSLVELVSDTPAGYAKSVELRIDSPTGKLIAKVPIAISSAWNVDAEEPGRAEINVKVTGVHDLYICVPQSTCNLGTMVFYTKEKKENYYFDRYVSGGALSDVNDIELENAIDVLVQLGIIKISDDGKYNPDIPATRAEFAQAVYRIYEKEPDYDPLEIINGSQSTAKYELKFEDVKKDSEYAEAIGYLSEHNLMNGVGESLFKPDTYISYADAVTVIVRMLGFDKIAETKGGYPGGFIRTAIQEKIVSANVDSEALLRRDDMAFLIRNAIEADYLEADSYTSDGYTHYARKNGIMSLTQGVFSGNGTVKANHITRLTIPGSSLDINQIKIDDGVYNMGGLQAESMLGMEVDFWYTEEEGIKTLRGIIPQNSVEITELDSDVDDIAKLSNEQIVYTQSGSTKEEVFEISEDTPVIYNGVAADARIEEILDNLKSFNGFINLIENGDGTKVVVIEEYKDLEIESINVSNNEIRAVKYGNETKGALVEAHSTNCVVLKNQAQNDVKLSDFKVGDIITVYQSKNLTGIKLIKVFRSNNTLTGIIDKVDDSGIYIDGQKRIFSNRYEGTKEIGAHRKFYLNIYNEIVKSEGVAGVPQVGLFFGSVLKDDVFNQTAEIKIMTTNSKSVIYPLANRVLIDGEEMDLASAVNGDGKGWQGLKGDMGLPYETPIRYKVNSKGIVYMIDTPGDATDNVDNTLIKIVDEETKFRYDSAGMFISGYVSPNNILAYCPNTATAFGFYSKKQSDVETRINSCVVGTPKEIFGTSDYQATGGAYSTVGDKWSADILIYSDKATDIANKDDMDEPFVFRIVSTKLDSNGEVINIIKGVSPHGEIEYVLSEEYMSEKINADKINSLKAGDIICVNSLPDKSIAAVKLLLLNDGGTERVINANGDKVTPIVSKTLGYKPNNYGMTTVYIYGRVEKRDKKYMVIDVGGSSAGVKEQVVSIPTTPLIDIYDNHKGDDIIAMSGQSSANVGVGDTVFLYMDYGRNVTFAKVDTAVGRIGEVE